jgi:transcriptional regulator with XRE-family HTH domain
MKIDNATKKRFGNYLRSLRAKVGLTQQEAAKQSGISHTYIAQLEIGARNAPSYGYLERFAALYQVSVDLLAREAGYGQGVALSAIPLERLEWAFNCVCTDPHYVYGVQISRNIESLEAKALVVEIYQQGTGRQLLLPEEQQGLLQKITLLQSQEGLVSNTKSESATSEEVEMPPRPIKRRQSRGTSTKGENAMSGKPKTQLRNVQRSQNGATSTESENATGGSPEKPLRGISLAKEACASNTESENATSEEVENRPPRALKRGQGHVTSAERHTGENEE